MNIALLAEGDRAHTSVYKYCPPGEGRSGGLEKSLVATYVIGRAKSRELDKIAYEMRLIEVPKIYGEIRPIYRGVVLDKSARLLKPLNPTEQFRRDSNFCLEDLNESTLA